MILPIKTEELIDIYDPVTFGSCGASHRLTLFPRLQSAKPTGILNRIELPVGFAGAPAEQLLVNDVSAYVLRGCTLGGEGFLRKGDGIVFLSDVYPSYLKQYAESGSITARRRGALFSKDQVIIQHDGLCASPFHFNDSVYGHFILETMPKLYLMSLVKDLGLQFRIMASCNIPKWAADILYWYFDRSQVDRFNPAQEVVVAPGILVTSAMSTSTLFHPMMNLFVADVIKRAQASAFNVGSHPLIYLSRRAQTSNGYRKLLNEDEVERVMEEKGFVIVKPETISFPEQILLFSQAKCLAGEYSSALHNALFAPTGCNVIAINRVNGLQERIADLRRQRLAYVPPRDGVARTHSVEATSQVAGYKVDLGCVSRLIDIVLREPEEEYVAT